MALKMLTPAFCARLLARGIIPTWHERFDDGTVDPVGCVYTDSGSLEEEPQLPVDPQKLAYVLLRKIGTEVANPIPPFNYEEYLNMAEEERLGFGHPEKGIIDADAMGVAMCAMEEVKDEHGKVIGHKNTWLHESAEILPLMKFAQHPNMQALHYGSALFEGITCEYDIEGNICIFDLRGHFERLNEGARELNLPTLPSFEFFKDAVMRVIKANKRFIPPYGKGRLYIRPNLIDVGPRMKVKNSHLAALNITATPIGNAAGYFGALKKPIIMGVPRTRVRAVKGGCGGIKAGGNYTRTIRAIQEAERLGLSVVGYLDRVIKDNGVENQAELKETNASNLLAFEKLEGGKWGMLTPALKDGDILGGRTRAMLIQIARKLGFEVEEESLSLNDVKNKRYQCLATCGTAAYINPIHGMQFFDLDPREDLQGIDEGALAEMSEEQQMDYRRERVGILVGDEVMFGGKARTDKNWTPDELMPEPIRLLLEAMEKVKRGECDDPELQEISDGLLTKFSLAA